MDFRRSGSAGGTSAHKKSVTQALNAGPNTVNHASGYNALFVQVIDNATGESVNFNYWENIDTNNIDVNLAGGSIASAKINIIY